MTQGTETAFLRRLSSAVVSQALLSAGNFVVGLVLIRAGQPEQYGYYVLIWTAVQLLYGLQLAFFQPALMHRLTTADLSGRRDYVGGAYREQRRWLKWLAFAVAGGVCLAWAAGAIDAPMALLLLASVAASVTAMVREFFRMVMLAYRMPTEALRIDVAYVAVLVAGAWLATRSSAMAATAVFGLAAAAALGGWRMSRQVRRHEGWNIDGAPGILAEAASLGLWAVIGASIHWAFSQGYIYLVAGTLDVSSVATISATRLVMMPVNLMTIGIGNMTYPTVSKWLQRMPVAAVLRRLLLLAAGIAGLALVYLVAMWLLRDFIFTYVIKGRFEHRDALLLMWSAAFVLMAMRDQVMWLPAARGRFRVMAWLTLATAVLSLAIGYVSMRHLGVVGALVGVLTGEAFNILGFLALSLREVHMDRAQAREVRA